MLKHFLDESFKNLLFLAILFGIATTGYCQHKDTDSLINAVKEAESDSAKAEAMYNLSYVYQVYKPDSALLVAQQLYDFSVKNRNLRGQSLALDAIAGAFLRMGDNTKSLEYYLKRLKIEEQRAIPYNLAIINMNIANVYNRDKDTAKASYYILIADSIISADSIEELKPYVFLNAGNIFEKSNRLSEAMRYTQKSYQLAMTMNDTLMIGSALNNIGNIYYKLGGMSLAIKNYVQSQYFIKAANDNQTLTEGLLGLAKAYKQQHRLDSALYFAKRSYNISDSNKLLANAMASSRLLADLYKEEKKFDSAFTYQSIMITLRDSLQGIERIKQLESITIQEQLRQQHIAAQVEIEKEEYRQRLQLLGIGIAIPFFFLFSVFISRRKVHRRLIQFFGILSLLLFFEYLTLLLHPVVMELTHHTPVLEIMIFVGIAALIVPVHHRIEHWFTKHLSINYESTRKRKQEEKELAAKILREQNEKAMTLPEPSISENKKESDAEVGKAHSDPEIIVPPMAATGEEDV